MLLPMLIIMPVSAQDAISELPNLIVNGSFEADTNGWRIGIGPREWSAARGIAEVIEGGTEQGRYCLRLNAREQPGEVDVLSDPVPVEPKAAYLLLAQVKQLGGEGGYKVTIDWLDATGQHLAYDNDWKGNNHPTAFTYHGGVFIAPEGAAKARLILGVSRGAECLFDEIRLSRVPGPLGESVSDGSGHVEAEIPASVEAGGYETFRFVYHPGEQGLPAGASLYFRRDNINPRWSPPQVSDPKGPGYVAVQASNGALCIVQPGSSLAIPCVTRIVVAYPPLKPQDTLTITYGDTTGGGPGAQVQTEAESGIHFVISVDGDRDERPLDLPDTPPFDVVSGPLAQLAVAMPPVVEAGVPFSVALQAQDRYGNPVEAEEEVIVGEVADGNMITPQKTTLARGQKRIELSLSEVGERQVAAVSARAEKCMVRVLVSRSPARPPDSPPAARAYVTGDTCVLTNGKMRLLLPRNDGGFGVAFLEANNGGAWRPVGVFPHAAAIVPASSPPDASPTPIYLREASVDQSNPTKAGVRLSGRVHVGEAVWDISVEYWLTSDGQHVNCLYTAKPDRAVAVRSFMAPVLFAGVGSFGSRKESALFPGLEYLTADEVSSGEYGIVEPYAQRSTPHPLKVTLPLMAVTADGLAAALFWDPTESPMQDGAPLQPTFLSPACRSGSGPDAHMFALGLPVGGEKTENAPEPVTIQPERPLNFSVSLAALAGVSDVTDVVRYWFHLNGVPDLPPMPRPWDEAQALTMRGLLETAWDPEKKGWHNALSDPWGAGYNDQIALHLWHYSRAHPDSPLTPKIQSQLQNAFEAAGGMRGYDFAFHGGDPVRAWVGERMAGVRDALAMSPDGSYAYHPHSGNKMFTQAQAKSIGREGEVNIGTCVMGLEPLMRRALISGDPFLVAEGEKGLAYIDRFTRPQGAENWEVPLACPNLRAAALATRCYLYGYLLTGKNHYLEKARFWATTGLPFIYMWNTQDRPIMRYGSISVMGTTLHTHTWFGRPVQWVGLVYASALVELAPYDDSFPWRKVAEGLLTCAMQMQKTEADICGHIGFYPDAYDVVEGKEAYHWCLAPGYIAQLSYALQGTSPRVSTTVVRTGEHRVHISAPGAVVGPAFEGGTLRFAVRYLKAAEHEVLVCPVAGVQVVLVDGKPLPAGDKAGWEVVAPGLLRIRVPHLSEQAEVELRGCQLTELPPALSTRGMVNGGFEQGLYGWAPSPAERAQESDESYQGKRALLLDARGLADEVQCTSTPLAVEAGRTYELSSWVKQVAGGGKYKVTIDWIGVGGHLRYDNDWLGADRPAAYAMHGGRFTAPAGAKAAVIILGVQPGTACLFDEVSFR